MSSTLAALGLPEPEKRDTLSRLGLPAPRLLPAHTPDDPFSAERIAARDKPVVPEYPIESVASIAPAVKAAKVVGDAAKALPWLLRSMASGAAAGATGGAIAESGKGLKEAALGTAGGAAAGAVLSPPLEGAAGWIGSKLARGAKPPVPVKAPVSPVEPVETLPVARNVGPSAEAVPVASTEAGSVPRPGAKAMPPEGPPKVTEQQFPGSDEFMAQVRNDPAYAERLRELGGGRVHTNAETLAKAWNEGPMHPDEIAAWTADKPVNEVIQTRALLTWDYLRQQRVRGILSGDLRQAAEAQRAIGHIQPGIETLGAIGGRTTQARAMFVNDEMGKILDSLADMQEKGVPFEQVQAKASEMVKAARRAAKLKGYGNELREAMRGIETAATFAKLTSPVTHAVNTISNALTFGVVRPLEKAGTAAAYLGQGNVPAARAEMSTVFGTRMGFRNGFERYVRTLMDDAADAGKAGEVLQGRNLKLPKALRPFDVFRQLSAADAFWKGVLRDARLNELAARSALEEGLKGPALAAKVKALVDSPPAQWAAEADAYAKEFTFQSDPDKFLRAVQKVQSIPGVRLFVPFAQTPYNLAKFQMQRSALGLASPRNLTGLAAGGKEQAEAVGRLTVGAGLSAGALALVQSTPTTGDWPSDPRERELWKAAGIKPYSIRLPNGQWLAYNRFAPVGMYIGQAVALKEAMERGDEKGVAAAAQTLAASSLKQVNDMPFLSGLSDFLDAIKDPERSAERFGTGVVTGMVPNILRDVRQQTDPTMREARGPVEGVQNMIPGLSQRLPASVDVFGRERTYEPSRATRATKVLSTVRESPEARLLAEVGWAPTAPDMTLDSRKSGEVELRGKDAEAFRRDLGEATRRAIARYDTASFRRLERDEQVTRLSRAVDDARKAVRERWKERYRSQMKHKESRAFSLPAGALDEAIRYADTLATQGGRR